MEYEFYNMIINIIGTPEYQSMKGHKHHIKTNTYTHSIKVAYLCYKFHRKFKWKFDINSLIRGALLHDYYLYDWHDKNNGHKFHLFNHPKTAYKNAIRDYANINKIEKDIILNHMFPVTITLPKTKAGWLVCLCDKIAAISDYLKRKS